MIAEGHSVNITLIFSPERHQAVMEATSPVWNSLLPTQMLISHGLPAWRVSY